ncbi:MAG: hypothetical protein ABIE36_00550 [Candidatus Diapherotrites archaeon]
MVKVTYTCEICNNSYSNLEDAEKCQEKGFIGPEIKPGLLLSHKKVDDGFLIFYNWLGRIGHERTYHLEEIISNDILTYGLQDFSLPSSKLKELMEKYRQPTKKELGRLNRLIQGEVKGAGTIKEYMDIFNIKELHNDFDLESFLNV